GRGPVRLRSRPRAAFRQVLPARGDGGPGGPEHPGKPGLHERGGRAAAAAPRRPRRRGRRRHGSGVPALHRLPGAGCPAPCQDRLVARAPGRRQRLLCQHGGRGLEQIRQEAALRGALADYLDGRDWGGSSATEVRSELQAYVAGRADLAWAQRPPAPPSVFFRAREAVHMAAVPLALALLLPVLLLILPVWAVALRL